MEDLELSPIVEGVTFTLPLGRMRLRAFVAAELLRESFGAGDSPSAWLSCAARHRERLLALALKQHSRTGTDRVVLTPRTVEALEQA